MHGCSAPALHTCRVVFAYKCSIINGPCSAGGCEWMPTGPVFWLSGHRKGLVNWKEYCKCFLLQFRRCFFLCFWSDGKAVQLFRKLLFWLTTWRGSFVVCVRKMILDLIWLGEVWNWLCVLVDSWNLLSACIWKEQHAIFYHHRI